MPGSAKTVPPISGALYNCGVNTALPTILEEIKQLATGNSNSSPSVKEEYEAIKTAFSTYYGLSNLTWDNFNKILQSESEHFYSQQLIMGPVLREYLANNAGEENKDEDEDGLALNSIINNGRFPLLEPEQIDRFLHKPLGINATWHSQNTLKPTGYDIYSVPNEAPNAQHQISMYFKLGHFELQPHEQVIPDYETNLNNVSDLFGYGTVQDTNNGLALLKTHVLTLYNKLVITPEIKSKLQDIRLKSARDTDRLANSLPHASQKIPSIVATKPDSTVALVNDGAMKRTNFPNSDAFKDCFKKTLGVAHTRTIEIKDNLDGYTIKSRAQGNQSTHELTVRHDGKVSASVDAMTDKKQLAAEMVAAYIAEGLHLIGPPEIEHADPGMRAALVTEFNRNHIELPEESGETDAESCHIQM